MSHTPGPWIWGNGYRGLYGAGLENEVLCYETYEGMWLSPGKHQKDNALLIEAAPDLLIVAKKAIEVLESEFGLEGREDEFVYDELGGELAMLYFKARNAIAKALGENI